MRARILVLSTLLASAGGVAPAAAKSTNPPDPVPVHLDEVWRVGEDQGLILGVVADLEVGPDGTVYVLDRQLSQVHVVSADGDYLRSVGREGEAPGEFRNASSLFLTPEGNLAVTMAMPGRVVGLTPAGEALDDLPLPKGKGDGPLTLGAVEGRGGNLVIYRFDREFKDASVEQHISLQQVAAGGEPGVVYQRMFVRDDVNHFVIDETERGEVLQRWSVDDAGRVWFAEGYTDYVLRVWNPDGTAHRVIERDIDPYRRSSDRIEERRDLIRSLTRRWPGTPEIRISDHAITIRRFHVFPDGTCWVLTSEGLHARPPGSLGVWDVIGADGNFSHRVVLMGEGDPERDALYLFDGIAFQVRGVLDSRLAAAGGAVGSAASEDEPPPLEVVGYRLRER